MIINALSLIAALVSQSGTSEGYQAAYDEGFRTSFRSHSIEQCRASASRAAAAKIDVTPICACVIDRLLATKSVAELKAGPPVAELQSLTTACIAANPPVTKLEKP